VRVSSKWMVMAGVVVVGSPVVWFFTRLGPSPEPQPPPKSNLAHERSALEESLRKKPDHVPVLFRLAQIARESGQPAEAVRRLRQILAAEPANVEAQLELGRALFEQGSVPEAIQVTERLLDQQPGNVDALYNIGAIHGNLRNDELARRYWQKAVALSPGSESGRNASKGLEQLASAR